MSRTSLTALAATVLLAATGCSSNRIVGHQLTQVGSWFGELGITGHLNQITIQAPSRVTRLSVVGDANKIVFDDHTTLAKIEIWGGNNIVSIPQYLVVRINECGKGNQIIRRSTAGAPSVEKLPLKATGRPPTAPPPTEQQPAVEPGVEPSEPESLPE